MVACQLKVNKAGALVLSSEAFVLSKAAQDDPKYPGHLTSPLSAVRQVCLKKGKDFMLAGAALKAGEVAADFFLPSHEAILSGVERR